MFTENRKINLIEAVIKVNDESILIELETLLSKKKAKKSKVFSAHNLSGIWNKKDAGLIKKAIKESCEQIHQNDWK